jgi:hypothetical protein
VTLCWPGGCGGSGGLGDTQAGRYCSFHMQPAAAWCTWASAAAQLHGFSGLQALQLRPAAVAVLLQMGANSVRLCEGYVSPACLAVMDADACVYQMVDSLRAPQQSAGLAPAAAVAIAVPLVVGECCAAGTCLGIGTQLAGRQGQGSATVAGAGKSVAANHADVQLHAQHTALTVSPLCACRVPAGGRVYRLVAAASQAAQGADPRQQRQGQLRRHGLPQGGSTAALMHCHNGYHWIRLLPAARVSSRRQACVHTSTVPLMHCTRSRAFA